MGLFDIAPDPAHDDDASAWMGEIAAEDDVWTVGQHPKRPAVADGAVFTVGEHGVGARGTPEGPESDAAPGVLIGGVYGGSGPEQQLLEGPRWTVLGIDPPIADGDRYLDLASGVLYRTETTGGRDFRSLRFACAGRPGVLVLRAEAAAGRLDPGPPLHPPTPDPTVRATELTVLSPSPGTETRCLRIESEGVGAIAAAASQRLTASEHTALLDRIVACAADEDDGGAGRAVRELRRAWELGVDDLLDEHRKVWARRWSTVGIDLPDDPEVELGVRFALFQLWSNAGAHGESAIGARGISGSGYRGHVFWDTDAFVLPAMASIDPAAAEAMIAYRLRRLPGARARALADGHRGARFPWESAADGFDVTPRSGFLGGTEVRILTGELEEHITADVAWAADHYAEWCGRPDFTLTTARELLTETARYWASRIRVDDDGHGHLDRVIGPDEYHETVDDNAFTNVMARWNLRRAARLHPRNTDEAAEFARWRELAERIVDQLRPDGRYEQFAGYFDLEPLTMAEVAQPPVAVDVLLGQQRVAGSQLIKQPDVLMMYQLVPEETAPGTLAANLDFYGPRTAHGSSLSPASMAALLARAGRPDAALEMLRPALRLDLDDRTGSTATGLHMATIAGVWQAMLTGFAGVRVRDGVLRVRPVLPDSWPRLGIAFRALGRCIRLDITRAGIGIRVDGPVTVQVGDHDRQRVVGESWWPTR
ncbi:glycoside hydrolase family 65 protein [Nocardia uniformis]|uniref:Glycoside hydrolase family 65 protein n=1 Tax=Nocardia uniformis TaxID=53432 RepID=A0A849BWA0_9NOCA|nr:glycosyl hydrolase family 65 protein [Nocardia uniformis]NNH70494.1 glycoside hydrolase family 65 protein [Nocardia uniformis]